MASYDYPKAMDVNLRSPQGQPYQTSQFQNNSTQKLEPNYPKSPEKIPREDKIEDLPQKRRRVLSCLSFKYKKKFLLKYFISFFEILATSFQSQHQRIWQKNNDSSFSLLRK